MLPTEYREYLQANLNLVERFTGALSGLDERIDYTNILLTRLIELQGGAPITPVPRPDWFSELFATLDRLSTTLNRLAELGLAPVIPNKESFITGQRTVTTAGEAVQLITASIPISDGFALTVIAKPANTGYIYIGRTKGDAEGASKFDGLSAGLAHSLKVKNVNSAWVNSSVNGEGVSWYVEQ